MISIMRTIVLVLLMSCCSIAQDDRPDPMRTYAEGMNIAQAERRPLLVFVTQKVCPACKPALRILNDMRLDERLGRCVVASVDGTTPEGNALMIGKKRTPQIVVLDFCAKNETGNITKHGIEKVDEPTISKLIDLLSKRKTE